MIERSDVHPVRIRDAGIKSMQEVGSRWETAAAAHDIAELAASIQDAISGCVFDFIAVKPSYPDWITAPVAM